MEEDKKVRLISIEEIVPNRFQPRQVFGEKELNELADSIKEHGIIQPLILRPLGDKYEIIAGERRYKAASIAGLYNVPAIIIEKTDDESAELAIIENIQRKDLSPIEEAKSYQKLVNRGLTQEEIARKLGIAQPTVANKLRLLALPEEVQDALLNNKISERHARALLKIENLNDQLNILNRIINEKLNVKQTEEEINLLLGILPVKEEVIEEPKEEVEIFDIEPMNKSEEISYIPDEPAVEGFSEPGNIKIEPFEEEKEDIDFFKSFNMNSNNKNNIEKNYEEEKKEIPEIQVIGSDEPVEFEYLNAVDSIRDKIDELIRKEYKINKEEYDMENEYQIIIRIEK